MSEIDPRLLSDLTVQQISQAQTAQQERGTTETGEDFAEVLEEKLSGRRLQVSAHAKQRLSSRGVELNEQRLDGIEQTLDRVKDKGGNEALLMLSDAALLVSAENDTVITAFDPQEMDQRVVTGIDSAAWVEQASTNGTDAAFSGGSPAGGMSEAGQLDSLAGGGV